MNNTLPGYHLRVEGCLIIAKFWGEWDIPLDLKFMDELGLAMQSMRGKGCWALVVDMRDWSIPDKVSTHMQPAKTNIERRNQKGECWLIKDERQGAFLLPLFEPLPFDVYRTKTQNDVLAWLRDNQFDDAAVERALISWNND